MAESNQLSTSSPNGAEDANPSTRQRLGAVGFGMTGLILRLEVDRVVKVPKIYGPESFSLDVIVVICKERGEYLRAPWRWSSGQSSAASRHPSSGSSSRSPSRAIWENYITNNNAAAAKPPDASGKTAWMFFLIDALCFIHSRRVLVDEIALRNIPVTAGGRRS
ncbi:MAG: hypothetical protein M1816_000287 [Peltula sp. TS41687]|nr:MAG: hypothetical protein M1816_000287 [Peltula sp. TS41687]